jgi:hypothetical protein
VEEKDEKGREGVEEWRGEEVVLLQKAGVL